MEGWSGLLTEATGEGTSEAVLLQIQIRLVNNSWYNTRGAVSIPSNVDWYASHTKRCATYSESKEVHCVELGCLSALAGHLF